MKFETGDIILVKVNNFSAWYRWLLAKLIQLFDGVYYHHAGTIVDGQFYDADKTVVKRDTIHLFGDEIIVFRLKEQLDPSEIVRYRTLADQSLGKKYDYFGTLLHQLLFILTFRRIWMGRTKMKSTEKQYCTEFAVHMIHQIRGYFAAPWKTGPSSLIAAAPRYYDVVFEGTYVQSSENARPSRAVLPTIKINVNQTLEQPGIKT